MLASLISPQGSLVNRAVSIMIYLKTEGKVNIIWRIKKNEQLDLRDLTLVNGDRE